MMHSKRFITDREGRSIEIGIMEFQGKVMGICWRAWNRLSWESDLLKRGLS